MSLKVWLPLNGDLKNKGSSKITVVNGGATVNTAGKIGSCYSFDGSDDYISLQGQVLYDIFKGGTQPFSVAFWVYHADSTRAIIFGDYSLSGAINFNIELGTNHSIRFYWNGTPDKSFNSESYVAAAGWTHICLTYDGSKVQIYKDGILSSDNYNGTLATKSKTSGVYYLGRDSRTGSTVLNGRLNDFRIYDHCLSKQEVIELAKGLVLHYKLDNIIQSNLLSNNPNLVNAWTQSGITLTQDTDGSLKCVVGSGEKRIYNSTSNVWTTVGNTYTVSFLAKAATNGTQIKASRSIADYAPNFILTTDWQYYSGQITITATSTGGTLSIQGINTNEVFWLKNVKLENGTIPSYYIPPGSSNTNIYDSSGYGNNGVTNGTFNADVSSAYYDLSMIFNGSDNAILIPFNNLIHDDFTFTCWFYKTSIGSKGYQTLLGGPSGFELEARNSSGTEPQIVPWNWGKNLATYNFNEWTFVAFTRDTNQTLLYVNGEYKTTGTAGTLPTGNYYIGAWNTPTQQNFEGKMSDVRLYSTVLTAQQILDLYKNEVSIDNKENIYARELVEE